jgi:PAS domain S-box-containing protein
MASSASTPLREWLEIARARLAEASGEHRRLTAPVLAEIDRALEQLARPAGSPPPPGAPEPSPASLRGESGRLSLLPADEALGVTEQRLSTMLRAIGDAVIATDAAGRIIFINAVAEALTGWTDVEARGLPLDQVFRIVDASTRSVAESPFARAVRETGVLGPASPTLLLRRDGAEVAVDVTAAPVHDPLAELAGVVLVFRDITPTSAATRIAGPSSAPSATSSSAPRSTTRRGSPW